MHLQTLSMFSDTLFCALIYDPAPQVPHLYRRMKYMTVMPAAVPRKGVSLHTGQTDNSETGIPR